MRELYNEYFHVPKEGKVREKVLFSRITVAVIIMLIWMSAIGFTAYAYFTCSVTSGINTITSATYGMETEIVDSDDSQTKLEPSSQDGMTSIYEVGAGVYNITLTATGTATTGYCKIEVKGTGKTVTLFTQQISPGGTISFTLVPNADATVVITPQWGTYFNRAVVVGNGTTQKIALVTNANTLSTEWQTEAQSDTASDTVPETSNSTATNPSEGTSDNKPTDSTNTQSGTTTDVQKDASANTQTGTSTDETTSTTPEGADDTTLEGADDTTPEDKSSAEPKTSEPTS